MIATLKELLNSTNLASISAQFRKAVSVTIQQLAIQLANDNKIKTMLSSGGKFKNKILFDDVKQALERQ